MFWLLCSDEPRARRGFLQGFARFCFHSLCLKQDMPRFPEEEKNPNASVLMTSRNELMLIITGVERSFILIACKFRSFLNTHTRGAATLFAKYSFSSTAASCRIQRIFSGMASTDNETALKALQRLQLFSSQRTEAAPQGHGARGGEKLRASSAVRRTRTDFDTKRRRRSLQSACFTWLKPRVSLVVPFDSGAPFAST